MRSKPLGLTLALALMATPLAASPVGANPSTDGSSPAHEYLTGPNAGDPEDIALDYFRTEAEEFDLTRADVEELVVRSSYESSHNGVTHVNINQRFEGREVFGADTTFNIADDGSVIHVGGASVSGLETADGASTMARANPDPVVAVESAARELDLPEPEDLEQLPAPRTADVDAMLSDGGISNEPIPAKLGWHPQDDGLRPAWQVVIEDATDVHLWNATVDAETSEVLDVEDWTSESDVEETAARLGLSDTAATATASSAGAVELDPVVTPNPVEDGSSYNVFPLPLESPNDGERSVIDNPADADASPLGWHTTDEDVDQPEYTITRGNNVHAYTDWDNSNSPTGDAEPDGGEELTFDFPLDLDDHPHDYWEAATANLFYWCNVAHDVFWHYGFDEASGNFQENNFGRGGEGGDPVDCEAQDGGGMNNANFMTPAQDGNAPRMQMYLWNIGPDPERDGDLEAGIILHEYSHGVSFRLTGGPNVNCLGGDQRMGEGWSDYHGIVTTIDPEIDDPDGPRGMGTYALWEDEPPRQGDGIRPAPYSRDMDIQPFTYESIGTGNWQDGSTLAAPHGVGHGWAAVLWDMTWDLIDKHGFEEDVYAGWESGGNNLSQQLVMDGLKMQGCDPNFIDGRDAIIAAETVLTGGEDFCTIWGSFARRGLGYSAESDGNARDAATEAFDTHPDCHESFERPVDADEELNTVDAGSTVPLRFDAGSDLGSDPLAANSPFSREVTCDTLEEVSEGEHHTPTGRPVAADSPGNSGISGNPQGVYNYRWQTDEDWAGTCREMVLTREDGVQHRAYFAFED